MKQILLFTLSFLIITQVSGADDPSEEKLVSESAEVTNKPSLTGWYGSLSFNNTNTYSKSIFAYTLGGGLVYNNNILVGLKMNIFNSIGEGTVFNSVKRNTQGYLKGGYVGLNVEPVVNAEKRISFSFPFVFGAGNIWFNSTDKMFDGTPLGRGSFYLVEPGIEMQLNLIKGLKLCGGISYRHTNGTNIGDLPYDILDGLNTGISIKFVNF